MDFWKKIPEYDKKIIFRNLESSGRKSSLFIFLREKSAWFLFWVKVSNYIKQYIYGANFDYILIWFMNHKILMWDSFVKLNKTIYESILFGQKS